MKERRKNKADKDDKDDDAETCKKKETGGAVGTPTPAHKSSGR
jgi:hypothetical protein